MLLCYVLQYLPFFSCFFMLRFFTLRLEFNDRLTFDISK